MSPGPAAGPAAGLDEGREPARVPGVPVPATSARDRLVLADEAGKRSAILFLSRSSPCQVPPPVPFPVDAEGWQLEQHHWAVPVERDSTFAPVVKWQIFDEWAGPSGAAERVDGEGVSVWRGFATHAEALTYLDAFTWWFSHSDAVEVDAKGLEMNWDLRRLEMNWDLMLRDMDCEHRQRGPPTRGWIPWQAWRQASKGNSPRPGAMPEGP